MHPAFDSEYKVLLSIIKELYEYNFSDAVNRGLNMASFEEKINRWGNVIHGLEAWMKND